MATDRTSRTLKSLIVAAGLAVSLATVAPAAATGPLNLQSQQFNAPIPMRAGQTNLFSAFFRHTGAGDVPVGTVFNVQLPKGFVVDATRIAFTASTANGLIVMTDGCSVSGTQVSCRTTRVIPGRPPGDTLGNDLSITVPVRVPGTPGSFVASYSADATQQIAELNERDNFATRTINVGN